MHRIFAEQLRGRAGETLEVEAFEEDGAHITSGVLREPDGYWYPILNGVPCLLRGGVRPRHEEFRQRHGLRKLPDEPIADHAEEQLLTNTTFSDKWRRFRNYGIESGHQEFLFGWYCRKLGVKDIDALKAFYATKKRILEVGPGSGFNSRFIAENTDGQVVALDISEAALTTHENTRHLPNCDVVQADLMDAPFDDCCFDLVIADGVLHHTPDTQKAVEALYRQVLPGGYFFFYVYKKMGAARQFCDAHIRSLFSKLEPEACYAACEGLTELGRELSRLKTTITLKQGVPALGIPPGKHDVQRLLYYNFLKCFWNEAFDFETNNMVNFDWYHPHNAWQHSEEEVASWLQRLGISDYVFTNANPNGISVLLTKPRD